MDGANYTPLSALHSGRQSDSNEGGVVEQVDLIIPQRAGGTLRRNTVIIKGQKKERGQITPTPPQTPLPPPTEPPNTPAPGCEEDERWFVIAPAGRAAVGQPWFPLAFI